MGALRRCVSSPRVAAHMRAVSNRSSKLPMGRPPALDLRDDSDDSADDRQSLRTSEQRGCEEASVMPPG